MHWCDSSQVPTWIRTQATMIRGWWLTNWAIPLPHIIIVLKWTLNFWIYAKHIYWKLEHKCMIDVFDQKEFIIFRKHCWFCVIFCCTLQCSLTSVNTTWSHGCECWIDSPLLVDQSNDENIFLLHIKDKNNIWTFWFHCAFNVLISLYNCHPSLDESNFDI